MPFYGKPECVVIRPPPLPLPFIDIEAEGVAATGVIVDADVDLEELESTDEPISSLRAGLLGQSDIYRLQKSVFASKRSR